MEFVKLWIDDVRPAPNGYLWCKTVIDAQAAVFVFEEAGDNIALIDIDHDAGEYVYGGGDYIKLLDWLEETGRNYPIRIHSMNPVGVENMRRIIQKNGWTEVR